MRATIYAIVLFAAVVATARASATCVGDKLAPLRFEIEGNTVSIRGATDNGKVLFVGYGRSWNEERYTSQFERYRSFLTADAKGDLMLEFDRDLPPEAVFAAVDLHSGRCGSISMSLRSHKDHRRPFDPTALRPVNGKTRTVVLTAPRAHLVVIRPEVGVWDLLAGDGSSADEDATIDGSVSFNTEKLRTVWKNASAPESIQTGDIVLIFKPHQPSLAFWRLEE